MYRCILLFFTLCISTALFAESTLIFNNGDQLSGTILEQDKQTVRVRTDSLGEITIDMEAIKEIIPSASDPQMPDTPKSQEEAPEPTLTKEPPGWSGQAGLALAMRDKSTSDGSGVQKDEEFKTYRVHGHINWEGKKNSFKWNWIYRYSEDETRTRDDFLNITQRYNRSLFDGFYAESKTVYQRDLNRNIDNEYLQTAEFGKNWFAGPAFSFSTSVGGGYHQYERSVPGESARIREPRFIFDELLEWKLVHSLKLFQKYTHLGDLEKYHFVFSSGIENRLVKDLFLRLEYRVDADTETSYDGQEYMDKAFLTSLLYTF